MTIRADEYVYASGIELSRYLDSVKEVATKGDIPVVQIAVQVLKVRADVNRIPRRYCCRDDDIEFL
jgi:hypothetical protein